MGFELRSIHRADGLLLILIGSLDEDAAVELVRVVEQAPRGTRIDVRELLTATDEGIRALRALESSGAIILNASPGLRGRLDTTPPTAP